MTAMQVAIAGGGLAGLNGAAFAPRDFRLSEARDDLGGRIRTVGVAGDAAEDGFDLGPSWFWPRMQPAIAALPPRVLERTVSCTPGLPPDIRLLWAATPTWMASHAKFFALDDRPFWHEAGCSGIVQSMAGPMPEIHDATTASGQAALFGFPGIGPVQRQRPGKAAPAQAWISGPWAERLVLAGSETSPAEAGYLSGAVQASAAAARDIPLCRGALEGGQP